MKRLPSLRSIADIALIVASIAVAAVALRVYEGATAGRARAEANVMQVKQRMTLPGVDFAASQQTLVVVLSSKCQYCTRSMPFYARLMKAKSSASRLIAIGGEPANVITDYLEQYEVAVDGVATVTAEQTPSRSTPTMFLVGQDGVVRKVWRGAQPPEAEAEIIKLVSS